MLLLLTSCASTQVTLRLRFQEDQAYTIRMITTQEISMTMMGIQQNISQTIRMDYSFDVVDVDSDGVARVAVTYRAISFDQKGPMGSISYDSSKPETFVPPSAAAFAALVGHGFSMKITPKGSIASFEGLDRLFAQIAAEMDLPEGPIRDSIEENYKNILNEQSLKETMGTWLGILPERSVRIGDSWTKRIAVTKGFPMIIENTWTLAARENGTAVINTVSTIQPNPEAEPLQIGPSQMSYTISGTQEGFIHVDEKTGWTTGGEIYQSLSGQIDMQGDAMGMEDISWPIAIKSVIRFETY